MRFANVMLPTLLLLCAAWTKGTPDPAPESPPGWGDIVNGGPDTGDPAVVEIAIGCTGAVIGPRAVLTAAHCVEGTTNAELAVFFGNDISQPGITIQAVGSVTHPSADLAVIMLAEDSPYPPVLVNSEDLQAHLGETVRPVGFGTTSENGPDEFGIKRHGTTKLNNVDTGLMYIGIDPSMVWTCYGDSGGPHFMMIGGVEKTVGVTSFGTAACGEPDDAEVRTDTYFDWISQYIAEAPAAPDAGPGPGSPDGGGGPGAPDAGDGAGVDDTSGGCGCRVGGQPARAPGAALLLGPALLGAVIVIRRRATRASAPRAA